MHTVLNELMNEAAEKTKREIESLKAIYNRNIEKMIDECSMLETVSLRCGARRMKRCMFSLTGLV